MTIATRHEDFDDVGPRVYSGTSADFLGIVYVNEASGLVLMDLPFSLVADTLLLPVTIPEQINLNRKTKFLAAGEAGDIERVRGLLEERPELAHESYLGSPFICRAAATGQVNFVALLREYGADANACDRYDKTPL